MLILLSLHKVAETFILNVVVVRHVETTESKIVRHVFDVLPAENGNALSTRLLYITAWNVLMRTHLDWLCES